MEDQTTVQGAARGRQEGAGGCRRSRSAANYSGDAFRHDGRRLHQGGDRLDRDGEASEVQPALYRTGLPADAGAARLFARERLQDLHRLRRRHRIHAAMDRACLRHSTGTSRRLVRRGEIPDPRGRKAAVDETCKGRIRRRRPRQAGRHQPLHRPAADLRVRPFRRRPSVAAMNHGGKGAALRRPRPPYRCDARIRLRSGFQSRQARSGARRGDGEGLGRRGHEAGLEDDISGKTLRRLGVKTAVVVALAMSCLTGVAIAQQPLPTDRLSQNRAVEAVIWGMPAVNYDLMLQEMLTKTPGKVNQVIYWGKPLDWHNQTLT